MVRKDRSPNLGPRRGVYRNGPIPEASPSVKVQLPLAALIVGAAATFSVSAVTGPAVPGAVVCGGIGSGERAALEEQARGTNLALEFFIARRGDYLADVDFALTPLDARGEGRPMDAVADGPLCYVKVPPGRYRIDAEFNGVRRSARATVPEHPLRPVRVALAFPEEAARGDLETRPTPEEREEARQP
jgi:hypothetical protein